MSQRTQLPIQDSNHPGLSRMQNDVIKLVVAVNDAAAFLGQVTSYVGYDFVEVRVRAAELLAGGYVADASLLGFDKGEGVAVAGVEVGFLAEGGEADGVGVDGV